jgi:hypothetical protein
MNKRIKELAIEARLLTGWPVGEVEYQKFAELIVRECIEICLTGTDTQITSEGAAQKIRQYFGLEQ